MSHVSVDSLNGPTRQRVTLLFTDLVGSTGLGRTMEPEEFSDLLDKLRAIWRRVAELHGGRVIRSQGDGALILFGFPQLREDDGREAAHAALKIHAEIGALRVGGTAPLSMRSGIHAGTALVAPGDVERGRVDLTGDVANTAAHLAKLAGVGQVVASLEALGPNAHLFDLGELPEGTQGIAPGQLRVILGRNGLRRRFESTLRRGVTPLVGRETPMEQVDNFLRAPREDLPSGCLVVSGEAGIGKTRLIEEALAPWSADEGTLILRGTCEREGSEVLRPFAEMLRSTLGLAEKAHIEALDDEARKRVARLCADLPEAAPGLLKLAVFESEAQPAAAGSRMLEDLLQFLAWTAAQQRTVLSIDDWHWADDASLQLLSALLADARSPRVILSCRPQELRSQIVAGAVHVHLAPLAEAETREVVRRWLPYADPFVCAQIHRYSGGVPLYLEELCHSASVGELARAIEDKGVSGIWISTLAATRLARLPPHLVELTRAAAVIGNEAPLWLLSAVLGRTPDQQSLAALADADFLFSAARSATLRFKHGVTRDAVYESTGLQQRRALHQKVLDALARRSAGAGGDEDVEALAHHSQGAGNWLQAAACAEEAGDKALAASAIDRARVLYRQGMEALDRVRRDPDSELDMRWCNLAYKYGMTCVFDPLPLDGDCSIFEQAVQVAQALGDRRATAHARYCLGYVLYSLGRFRDSRIQLDLALDLARETAHDRLAAQIDATMGQVLAGLGEYESAVERIDLALTAKSQRSPSRGRVAMGSAYALACKGGVLADRGQFDAAHGCFREALELLGGSTHPIGNSVRNWVAVAYNWQGRWSEAAAMAATSLEIAENTRALLLLSAARSSLAYARWASTADPVALEQLHEAMRWMQSHHSRFCTSIYHGWILAAETRERRAGVGRTHAAFLLVRAREGERFGEAVACRGLAWTAAERGEAGRAQRWLARAEASAAARNSDREAALNAWMRARVAQRLDNPGEAERWFDTAAAGLAALQMRWHGDRLAEQRRDDGASAVILT